jgi:hypothetical protein
MLAWCACFMADHTSSALVRDRAERIELKHLKSSRFTPQKIALRASIILHAADGQANLAIVSVDALKTAIHRFLDTHNTNPKIFPWT